MAMICLKGKRGLSDGGAAGRCLGCWETMGLYGTGIAMVGCGGCGWGLNDWMLEVEEGWVLCQPGLSLSSNSYSLPCGM